MMNTNEREQTTPHGTPTLEIGSNDMNMTPLKIGFVQCIQSKAQQHYLNSQQMELKTQVDNKVDMIINEQFWMT